jgi:hypothetical protein
MFPGWNLVGCMVTGPAARSARKARDLSHAAHRQRWRKGPFWAKLPR